MTLRLVFLGTPEFALPSLEALLADPEITIAGVMTQPDRPSGRGQKLTPPPVKLLAEQHGIEVRQPTRLRKEPEMVQWLRDLQPDYLVTAAFGQILSQEVLDIPRLGTVNVHASLLPHYRGANPVQWSILNGDAKTGITTMFTTLGVDEGPMLLAAETDIDPDEDTGTLTLRLAQLGAGILPQSLHDYAAGTLQAREQDVNLVTHAPKLAKEDAWLDWSWPAQRLHDKIRGQHPWPGALARLGDLDLKIGKSVSPKTLPQGVRDSKEFLKRGTPGEILAIIPEGLLVQTGTDPLLVTLIQPPGKPRMSARDWANGGIKPGVPNKFVLAERLPEPEPAAS